MSENLYSLEKANELVARYVFDGVKRAGGLTYQQTRQIFLVSLKDYLEGKIHIYDLGNIAEEIYYNLNNFALGTGDRELDKVLSDLSDIDIYHEERNESNKYEETLKSLNEYWEQHRNELAKEGKSQRSPFLPREKV